MEHPKGEGDIDAELNKLFKAEGYRVLVDEIEKNEKLLFDVRNAMKVLEYFGGNGLADSMPLGEALGFLDAELVKKQPEMNKVEISRAREFLLQLIGEKYPEAMPVGALMEEFSKVEKKLLEG